jgi:hypothetical protein
MAPIRESSGCPTTASVGSPSTRPNKPTEFDADRVAAPSLLSELNLRDLARRSGSGRGLGSSIA